jgi:hypothetical protein
MQTSECLCFEDFPERRFELAAKQPTEKLPGDLQDAEYVFVAGFQFREEFLLLQVKCDLLVGDLFISKRSKSGRCTTFAFMHWSIGKYPSRKPSTVICRASSEFPRVSP